MFRWYTENNYSWYWDSRHDCWHMSCPHSEKVLQYYDGNKWQTVPSIVKENIPPKPKN